MLRGEATNTNGIFFDLTCSGLEPRISRIRGEHAKHYTMDAVATYSTIKIQLNMLIYKKAKLIIISLKMNLFSP
jgi:hypothetical protein